MCKQFQLIISIYVSTSITSFFILHPHLAKGADSCNDFLPWQFVKGEWKYCNLRTHKSMPYFCRSESLSIESNFSFLPRGEGTHIWRHTGMCRSKGSLFHKKSLNMGPIFYKNIPRPKHGFVFPKFPNFFWVFAWWTPENCEKWAFILRKIP